VRTACLLGAAGLAAQWGPALTSIGPLRRRIMPKLAGSASSADVALTYDDGPDPRSTPQFLDLLASYDVSATFFLLGSAVTGNATLVKEMAGAGHELAVHGWDHQCLAWKRPGLLADELRRTQHTMEDLTGVPVTRYRPPYGVMTGEGMLAARRTRLRTVLWSAWGRDWSRHATTQSIVDQVYATLLPGGTVLLHDTDRTSAPGSWRATLNASDALLNTWAAQDVKVGSLRDRDQASSPADASSAGHWTMLALPVRRTARPQGTASAPSLLVGGNAR
jgi:peptidoglycan/xylan/chitin deacetylase (PgdA/CDA1 family)